MFSYSGGCHCARIKLDFRTHLKPLELVIRACSCSFCRGHGARTTRDPEGRIHFQGKPKRYQFGLRTADFFLCPNCGIYLCAVMKLSDREFATLNINCLDNRSEFSQEPQLAEYGVESAEERIARRAKVWTPFFWEST